VCTNTYFYVSYACCGPSRVWPGSLDCTRLSTCVTVRSTVDTAHTARNWHPTANSFTKLSQGQRQTPLSSQQRMARALCLLSAVGACAATSYSIGECRAQLWCDVPWQCIVCCTCTGVFLPWSANPFTSHGTTTYASYGNRIHPAIITAFSVIKNDTSLLPEVRNLTWVWHDEYVLTCVHVAPSHLSPSLGAAGVTRRSPPTHRCSSLRSGA
jgi:hypothetical protein